MYIRFTQPPADLFDWYEEFLQDDEEIDVKAGGGQTLTIGQMCRQFMVKLDWFSTLFPRIPVPFQKQIEQKLADYDRKNGISAQPVQAQRYVPPQPEQRRETSDRHWDRDRVPKEKNYREERKRSRSNERRRRNDDEPSSYRQSRRFGLSLIIRGNKMFQYIMPLQISQPREVSQQVEAPRQRPLTFKRETPSQI